MINVKKRSLNGVYVFEKHQKICERIVPGIPRQSLARYRSSAQHCQKEEPVRHVFYHFRYKNGVKFKNNHAPATLKKCA